MILRIYIDTLNHDIKIRVKTKKKKTIEREGRLQNRKCKEWVYPTTGYTSVKILLLDTIELNQ